MSSVNPCFAIISLIGSLQMYYFFCLRMEVANCVWIRCRRRVEQDSVQGTREETQKWVCAVKQQGGDHDRPRIWLVSFN